MYIYVCIHYIYKDILHPYVMFKQVDYLLPVEEKVDYLHKYTINNLYIIHNFVINNFMK